MSDATRDECQRRQQSLSRRRWAIYALLIVVGAGATIGRICVVKSDNGRTPFCSANDRSRWSAVRALGDHGEFHIDRAIVRKPDAAGCRERFDNRWNSIDKVRHIDAQGEMRYYSSKPPLLSSIVAGEYWLLKKLFGLDFERSLFLVVRLLLAGLNVASLVAIWLMLARLVERFGVTQAGRLFVMTSAVFGTYLTTFAVTFNNHLPAAVCVLAAISCALPAFDGRDRRWRMFLGAGFFAALAAANELPALSLLALLGAALATKSPLKAILGFLPAALVIGAVFWSLNLAAHQSFRPPYGHRSQGALVAEWTGADARLEPGAKAPPASMRKALADDGIELSPQARLEPAGRPNDWVLWDPPAVREWALVHQSNGFKVRVRRDWYDYECSYWTTGAAKGVDKGEPSRWAYAFHVLVGHHGLFSLTPLWIFSAVGVWLILRKKHDYPADLRALAMATIVLTLVCLAFYISRPLADRNYGGVSSGLRWLFWLIPLWLVCMIPAVDYLAKRKWGIALALVCLAISVFSAHYSLMNPWTHPWLFDVWTKYGGYVAGEPPTPR